MTRIDLKDKRILAMLDKNSRMPLTEIAKRVGLNKDVVRYRIEKLEKEKVILGYYTLIDTHKLGYLTIRIYFELIDMNEETEKKLIEFLDKKFNSGQIFRIDGEYQLGIITWEKSIYQLENKLKLLKKEFGDFIEKYEISIFIELHNYSRKYLPNKAYENLILKETNLVEIDKIDTNILKALSGNARITSVELSKKLNIPQRTVIYRIRSLEKKKMILGYRINLNISSLGYENYFLEIYTHKQQNIKEIENFALKNKNCIGIDYVLHGADIEIETEFPQKYELLDFLMEIKNRFKYIKKIKYWSTLNYIKINYFPD